MPLRLSDLARRLFTLVNRPTSARPARLRLESLEVREVPAAAVNDYYTMHQGGALVRYATDADGLLVNDRTDPRNAGQTLRGYLGAGPATGTLSFGSYGDVVRYRPRLSSIAVDGTITNAFVGRDSFTYKVSSDRGQTYSNLAAVTIDVTNTAPEVGTFESVFPTARNTSFHIDLAVLRGRYNASDFDGDELGVATADGLRTNVSFGSDRGGTVWLNTTTGFSYSPGRDSQGNPFVGQDTFRFRFWDRTGLSEVVTVVVNVGGDFPLAREDAYQVVAGQQLTVPTGSGVLANDITPPGRVLTGQVVADPFTAQTGPSFGTLTFNSNGSFAYTPFSFFGGGTDTFWYVASDGSQSTQPVKVTIQVDSLSEGQGTVSGAAWFDVNENGVADEGEPALNDLRVNLVQGGSIIRSEVVGDDGVYEFENLADGSYDVVADLPPGFFASTTTDTGLPGETVSVSENGAAPQVNIGLVYANASEAAAPEAANAPPPANAAAVSGPDVTDWFVAELNLHVNYLKTWKGGLVARNLAFINYGATIPYKWMNFVDGNPGGNTGQTVILAGKVIDRSELGNIMFGAATWFFIRATENAPTPLTNIILTAAVKFGGTDSTEDMAGILAGFAIGESIEKTGKPATAATMTTILQQDNTALRKRVLDLAAATFVATSPIVTLLNATSGKFLDDMGAKLKDVPKSDKSFDPAAKHADFTTVPDQRSFIRMPYKELYKNLPISWPEKIPGYREVNN